MKYLFRLGVVVVLCLQQYTIHEQGCKVALLVSIVEKQVNDFDAVQTVIPSCAIPRTIPTKAQNLGLFPREQ